MASVRREAFVAYSAEQMFALVNDIPRYPEFLPWCRSAHVLSETDSQMEARLEMAHSGIHKAFTTRNRWQEDHRRIDIGLVEGPFRHLQGHWRFEPEGPDACVVRLEIDFEFSNRLLSLALGPVFHHICNTLVDAFRQRAGHVYG